MQLGKASACFSREQVLLWSRVVPDGLERWWDDFWNNVDTNLKHLREQEDKLRKHLPAPPVTLPVKKPPE